jgi:type II secretion system protein N
MAKMALRKRIIRWAGYATFFVVCFIFFAYWTFPYDRVRGFIVQKVNRQKGAGGLDRPSDVQIQIAALSPHWFTGVKLEGVEMIRASRTKGGEPVRFSADRVSVRPSLISLLSGWVDLSFDVEIGEGEIEGRYKRDDKNLLLETDIDDVDVSRLGLGGLVGLPVKGRARGSVNLLVPEATQASQGSIDLEISGFTIGDGKAKLVTPNMRDGMTVETIDAGDLKLRLKVNKGKGEIEELTANGPDIELGGEGSIRLGNQLERSRLSLTLDIGFKDTYRKKNDRTRALFEIMEFNPNYKKALTSTGSLRYRVTGILSSPRTRPVGDTRGGSRIGRRTSSRKPARAASRKTPRPKQRSTPRTTPRTTPGPAEKPVERPVEGRRVVSPR